MAALGAGDDAKAFMNALTTRLGLDTKYVQAGYEDTWYYLWRERRLPVNVDPFDAKLDDEMERARLRRIFTQGLDSVVGYLLQQCPQEGDCTGSFDISLPTSKQVIASRLNLTPETLSRIFHDLTSNGLIGVSGKQITINDVKRLREFDL